MYIPRQHREEDLNVLQTFMRDYSFATLVSVQEDGIPVATALPFLLEPEPAPYGVLKAHMALGNPQWRTFQEDREVLVIFQGPHTYISPSWYEVELSVPTWNYAIVHAYGRPRIIEDQAELYTHLKSLVVTHESQFTQPWPFQLPMDYIERMMKGVVGFELRLSKIEGKFKLSQNRSLNEQERVIAELGSANSATSCEVAELMKSRLKQ